MPVLSDPRHELFCQLRLEGKTVDQAYQGAGFKANRHNAATLGRKQHIVTRMEELLAAKQKAVAEEGRWSAVALFDKMNFLVDKAVEAGEIKAAIDGHKTVLECFGYLDSPTLTHEHVKGQKIAPETPADGAGEASEPSEAQAAGANILPLTKAIRDLKRKVGG